MEEGSRTMTKCAQVLKCATTQGGGVTDQRSTVPFQLPQGQLFLQQPRLLDLVQPRPPVNV